MSGRYDRRQFLRKIGTGMIGLCGAMIVPCSGWAKTAFDFALEGQDLIQKKAYLEAIVVLQKAIQLDPTSDWAFGLLGRAYREIGDTANAVTSFRKALRLNPDDTFSRMMIDMMTQKPIPVKKDRDRPLTPLEKEALEEERRMLRELQTQSGLGYQVKRVVIDAGHGGFDPGAVGKTGLQEKDVTLDIAILLYETLKKQGVVKPFLTRTGDYYMPLSARTVAANQYQADLFISIHINAHSNRSAHGSETYYCAEKASSREAEKVAEYENSVLKFEDLHRKQAGYIDIEDILFRFEQKLYWQESAKFAGVFQGRFENHLPMRSRGVHSANFYVLRSAKMPSILLESGFISNPDEESMLKKRAFRKKIADAVAEGFI